MSIGTDQTEARKPDMFVPGIWNIQLRDSVVEEDNSRDIMYGDCNRTAQTTIAALPAI